MLLPTAPKSRPSRVATLGDTRADHGVVAETCGTGPPTMRYPRHVLAQFRCLLCGSITLHLISSLILDAFSWCVSLFFFSLLPNEWHRTFNCV